jgi:transposase
MLAWRLGDGLGWGDLIGAYGAAHAAYRRARANLAEANRLFETLRSLGMSEDGARRAADLDRLLANTMRARSRLQAALKEVQSNIELVRALNLVAAAEGVTPEALQAFVPDNDLH